MRLEEPIDRTHPAGLPPLLTGQSTSSIRKNGLNAYNFASARCDRRLTVEPKVVR